MGDSPVQGLAFSGDDKMLAVGSEDGYVLVYDTDTFRGGEIKQQAEQLCGEIKSEDERTFIAPISKLPGIMSPDFVYPWRLEIVNSDTVSNSLGLPVVLQNWAIESSSASDKARVNKFHPVLSRSSDAKNYIVFGVGENPGYGYAIKIFNNGNFVAANRDGNCLSYGNLAQFKTTYDSLRQRLLEENFIAIPKEPLTIGADHFRTAFIEIATDGVSEIRSDADSFELLMKEKGETAKRKAFSTVYTKEQAFIDSLLKAGYSIELGK